MESKQKYVQGSRGVLAANVKGLRKWGRGDRTNGNPIKSKFGAEERVVDHEVSKILVTTENTTRIQIVETFSE